MNDKVQIFFVPFIFPMNVSINYSKNNSGNLLD